MLILKSGTQHWEAHILVKHWSIFKIFDIFKIRILWAPQNWPKDLSNALWWPGNCKKQNVQIISGQSVCLLFTYYLLICLLACLSAYLITCILVYLLICLCVYLHICIFVYLFTLLNCLQFLLLSCTLTNLLTRVGWKSKICLNLFA